MGNFIFPVALLHRREKSQNPFNVVSETVLCCSEDSFHGEILRKEPSRSTCGLKELFEKKKQLMSSC